MTKTPRGKTERKSKQTISKPRNTKQAKNQAQKQSVNQKIKECGNYCFILLDKTLNHFICKNTEDKNDGISLNPEIEIIGKKSFAGDKTVAVVYFSEKLKIVEQSAFENCKKLEIFECKEIDGKIKIENFKIPVFTGAEKESEKSDSATENIENENTKIPDSFTIQHRAFKNCESLYTVILPEIPSGKKLTIESEAFYGCKALRTVVMTGYDTFDISPDAFEMCESDLLTFVVSAGSSAERFAREKGYRYVAV